MNTQPRSPVVVVLGHVDHGKTTLLDYIRKSNVAAKEEGSITQKVGAYEVETDLSGYPVSKITFIDTPGHEAFTKIRSRGATVADIAILLIDGVESVKPQTIESIEIIKKTKLPFIVAVNKIDLPNFNLDKVKKDLLRYEILTEGFGGTTPAVGISAKTGDNVKDLLEAILFISAEQKFSYELEGQLEAYVIEINKTKAGIAISCIIKNSYVTVSQTVFCEGKEAKIRSLMNDSGDRVNKVVPSNPFVLLGFNVTPSVGSKLTVYEDQSTSPEVSEKKPLSTADFFKEKQEKRKLKMVIKADNHGSVEAIVDSLNLNESVQIEKAEIGEITKSDILFAKVTGAIIINFNQGIPKDVVEIAKDEKVLIKTYSLIYKLLEEIDEVLSLYQEKDEKQSRFKGQARIIANFLIENQNIAGISIQTGKLAIGDEIELYRGDSVIGMAHIESLKQKTKQIRELKKNEEGGMLTSPNLDFKVGDMIKSYSI